MLSIYRIDCFVYLFYVPTGMVEDMNVKVSESLYIVQPHLRLPPSW